MSYRPVLFCRCADRPPDRACRPGGGECRSGPRVRRRTCRRSCPAAGRLRGRGGCVEGRPGSRRELGEPPRERDLRLGELDDDALRPGVVGSASEVPARRGGSSHSGPGSSPPVQVLVAARPGTLLHRAVSGMDAASTTSRGRLRTPVHQGFDASELLLDPERARACRACTSLTSSAGGFGVQRLVGRDVVHPEDHAARVLERLRRIQGTAPSSASRRRHRAG